MKRLCRSQFFGFQSCNPKSKIQNLKWLGLSVVAFVLVLVGATADAQQPAKIPRIGFISSLGSASNPGARAEAFRRGLRELGYVEGKNILIEYRFIEGKSARIPSLIAELIQLKVDVLVPTTLTSVRTAKKATQTIPIVTVIPDDLVAYGLAESMARSGGNVTGLTTMSRELSGKRLELLTELIPGLSRVGLLWGGSSANQPGSQRKPFQDYEAPARALKIALQIIDVKAPNPDLPAAFRSAVKEHVRALIPLSTSVLVPHSKELADLAIKHQLPTMFEAIHYVEAGGLMSYTPDDLESFKRAAIYVDKILKGAKPADLPVERPIKFEFTVNLNTAKRIHLTVPPNLLVRATRVIR